MPKLTDAGELLPDHWQRLEPDEPLQLDALPSPTLISLAHLDQHQNAIAGRDDIGVWVDTETPVEALARIPTEVPVIGVHFSAFTDGRGFSLGRKLRDEFRFAGELRAMGDFTQDQLFYLKRCGFDAFIVDEEDPAKVESMQQSLRDFSDSYQAAVDQPTPLFRRRQPSA